ncbi:MAG: hypothetical protein WCC64_16415 [Aliidongia sp.]
MIRLDNLSLMTNEQLKKITRAVYIVKCTNDDVRTNDASALYSCGAAGVRSEQNGNLLHRFNSHARDWRSQHQKSGRQLFRHRVSPFGTRVWAFNLADWTGLGVQLAEHALHFRLGLAFPFVSASCFLASSDDDVVRIVDEFIPYLEKIVTAGNSTAAEDKVTIAAHPMPQLVTQLNVLAPEDAGT